MLEKDIVRQCLDWLQWKRISCWRQNQGMIPNGRGGVRSFNGRKGIADISGIFPQTVILADGTSHTFGNRLEIEVKMPKKHASEDQQAFLDMINKQGGIAILVHSLEELQAQLGEYL